MYIIIVKASHPYSQNIVFLTILLLLGALNLNNFGKLLQDLSFQYRSMNVGNVEVLVGTQKNVIDIL